jgi:endogenous inhibitor of DNA gyrase (YacG/DUF329 family)
VSGCERCGKDVRHGRRFCSYRCIGLIHGIQRVNPATVTGHCPACDAWFIRKPSTGDIGKFCARQCYFDLKRANAEMAARAAHERAQREQRCRVCDGPVARRGGLCGDECRKAAARQQYRETYAHKTQTGVCPTCGKSWRFTGVRAARRFCSLACTKKAHQQSGSTRIRKAVRERGIRSQKINARLVLQRDRWRCHLCGVRTPARLRGHRHPCAPVVDHVVPLAMGGDNTYDNVKCACHACNEKKGAKWIGQPRLGFELVTR